MNLIMVRHPEVGVSKDLCYGCSDIELSKNGKESIPAIVEQIKKIGSGFKVYTSPLKRCLSIAKGLENYTIAEEIIEINFGDWELVKWDLIPRKEIDKWASDVENYKFPGGESVKEFKERVKKFYFKILSNNEDAILITHSGVIKIILCLLEFNNGSYLDFKVNFGEIIFICDIDKEKYKLVHYPLEY